jgi:SHS family lactate transporter-like MFS transporter
MRLTCSSFRDVLLDPVVVRRFDRPILLMTAFMSHGAPDVDPTFLVEAHDGDAGLPMDTATWIAVAHDVGTIIGGIVFGTLSERVSAPSRSGT